MSTTIRLLLVAGTLVTTQAAYADDTYVDTSYAWREDALMSGIGIGITLGGGVSGFTDREVRRNVDSDISGAWGVRAAFGTHIPLGLEVGYTGTTVDLPSSPLGTPSLLGTTVEGALRWNMLPHNDFTPYVFAGIGWQRYDLQDADLARADTAFAEQDDIAVVPMGAGIAYRSTEGLTLDARGTFRAATSSDLLQDANGNNADLHTWEASGNLGYEF